MMLFIFIFLIRHEGRKIECSCFGVSHSDRRRSLALREAFLFLFVIFSIVLKNYIALLLIGKY